MDSILPDSLNKVEHFKAIEQIVNDRFSAIEVESCLMYLIDNVSEAVLPYLAQQFNIINTIDWNQATTESERRQIVKDAYEIKSIFGTVAGIRKAVEVAGFSFTNIIENPGNVWGTFVLSLVADWDDPLFDGDKAAELYRLVVQYKNARSRYDGLQYTVTGITETYEMPTDTAEFHLELEANEPIDLSGFKYDGTHLYDGSKKYRPGVEDIQVTIVT